jgi:hypothetical protein
LAIPSTIWKEMMFLLPSTTKCWMPTVLFIRFTWISGESNSVATKSEYLADCYSILQDMEK